MSPATSKAFLPFLFSGKFEECGYEIIFKSLIEFSSETIRASLFFFGK
jgi:hypothetical protein